MNTLWWTLTVLLMLIGLVGTILPLLPGPLIILGGAFLNYFTLHSIGWPTLLVLTVLMLLGQLLDIVSGAVGAKWSGSTRWGIIGGILGSVVGLFFGFIGIFAGPLIGVFIFEIAGGRGAKPAARSSWGTFLGTTAGMIGKLLISLIMIVWFAVAVFLPKV